MHRDSCWVAIHRPLAYGDALAGEAWRNRSMFDVPEKFRSGPFARSEAIEADIPARVLEGVQFRRLHNGVYSHRDHVLTFSDRIAAARLALPAGARTTGITRIQELGLGHGPSEPLHFVVAGDHHLTIPGVFLHRTVSMPSADNEGVDVEAAFVAFCAEARIIDAIKVGSMLLHLELLDLALLQLLIIDQPWRRGVLEARWVLEHLDGRCRSLPEAELLTLVRFCGLPEPDVNPELRTDDGTLVIPDLFWAVCKQVVEYEGSHHQEDRAQYVADIDRFLIFRRMRLPYLQITKERMRRPQVAMRQIHGALVEAGYEGPDLEFGELWAALFRPLREVVRRGGPRGAVSQPHSAA